MSPLVEAAPLFGSVGDWGQYWIHLPILVVVISLVYAGTRYDDWPNIIKEARRWLVRLFGFLAVVVFVLFLLAWMTP